MRQVGLILSSLVTVGFLVTAGVAQACPGQAEAGCGCNHAKAAEAKKAEPAKDKKAEAAKDAAKPAECGCAAGAACAQPGKELTAPKSGKQGSLDDRLIRPQHRTWDASAGFVG